MRYREFGSTGMRVSEIGFGGWGIGGRSYGSVARADALRALARAEELGCNFVDTARVYGDSESILGEFLTTRRGKWLVATKYSGQPEGLRRIAEDQLRALRTDVIDLYQLHWVPRRRDIRWYAELRRLKVAGLARSIGVSLYTVNDIDFVLDRLELDAIQVSCNLLEPQPLVPRLAKIHSARIGVIVRSSLKSGFLTGKFRRDAAFDGTADLRGQMNAAEIARLIDAVEGFRFLEKDAGSLLVAAARYPLSFPEVSTVILGTKNGEQADTNFGVVPGGVLSTDTRRQIRARQRELGLLRRSLRERITAGLRSLAIWR